MPELSRVEIIHRLQAHHPKIPALAITALHQATGLRAYVAVTDTLYETSAVFFS
jgi:hypothetical protein